MWSLVTESKCKLDDKECNWLNKVWPNRECPLNGKDEEITTNW